MTPDEVRAVDGGLSTALELAGHDLRDDLWTARLLVDDPEAIVSAHLAYLEAGARVLISASYQASERGLMATGLSMAEARRTLASTTDLARQAVARFVAEHGPTEVTVAASVGPYGAILADGSEYRGHYDLTVDALVEFHRQRLEVLVASRPDILAVETIPGAVEAAAIVQALTHTAWPAWLTFTCRSGTETCAGDRIEAAIEAAVASPSVFAVGVNCTAPQDVTELLTRAASVTDLPLVVYANSGQSWDSDHGQWNGERFEIEGSLVSQWVSAGARYIGGCCGVGPSAISELSSLLATYR